MLTRVFYQVRPFLLPCLLHTSIDPSSILHNRSMFISALSPQSLTSLSAQNLIYSTVDPMVFVKQLRKFTPFWYHVPVDLVKASALPVTRELVVRSSHLLFPKGNSTCEASNSIHCSSAELCQQNIAATATKPCNSFVSISTLNFPSSVLRHNTRTIV